MKEFIIAILKSRYTVSIMTILTILLGRSLGLPPAQAQGGEKVEVLAGRTEPGAGIVYLLPNLERGQKLYVYAEGVSGNLDPLIALADETLDAAMLRENYAAAVQQAIAAGRDPLEVIPEVAGAFFLAWDDDGGQGYVAAKATGWKPVCSLLFVTVFSSVLSPVVSGPLAKFTKT